jgi:hypothetical protein
LGRGFEWPLGKLKACVAALYSGATQAPRGNAFDISGLSKPRDVEVWPENWPSFNLFAKVGTQWRAGMAGATGLDYCALYPLLDKATKDDAEWWQLFDDIQVMEVEALSIMASKNK